MPTLQEEITRFKELIFGTPETQTIKECGDLGIAKKAQSVHDRLGDSTKLEDWMESKIAQMADNIDSVSNSFDYDEHEDHDEEVVTTIDLGEEIMSGAQGGYADDSEGDNDYEFQSKGALGSEPELGDEGFTEPETNYNKIKKGYNFDSQGPSDSYDDTQDYGTQLAYELGEQDDGGGTGESDDAAGAGTASMGVWESGVARGIANQIASGKWEDSYQPTRGKSNPLM